MTAIPKQTPWEIQKSVVFAVFIRELQARFGKFTLGYLWAIIEPLAFIAIMAIVRGKFTGTPIAGLPPMVFFASGILPFFLFRNIAIGAISAVEGNQGLFNYQRVKPADALAARFLLELLIIVAVGLLVFPVFRIIGPEFHYNNTLQTLTLIILLLMFTAGVSLIFTVVGPLWTEAKKVLPIVLRPFFFISGVFFPISGIPPALHDYFLWNPILHALELFRASAFTGYTSTGANWSYLFWSSLLTFAGGLAIYRLYRIRIVTSGAIQ